MKPIFAFVLLWAAIIFFPAQTKTVAAEVNSGLQKLYSHVVK